MTAPAMFGLLSEAVPSGALDSIADRMEEIEDCLKEQSRSVVQTVSAVGESTLSAGGKRLRPALAVVSALSAGGQVRPDRIVSIGACLELVHMATLVHDDVIDEARTRRGRPTAASLVGNTAAILGGDVLLAKAMRLLAVDGDTAVIRCVSEAVVDLAEGEVMELELRGKFPVPEADYLSVVDRKTSALISCACQAGAMTSDAGPMRLSALAEYGRHLGNAFQIADDVLDYNGDRAKTGKPWATDFREGQPTLPLILLGPRLDSDESVFVETRFGNGVVEEDLVRICGWMKDRGAYDDACSTAQRESELAVRCLDPLPESPYKSLLAGIARYVTDRES